VLLLDTLGIRDAAQMIRYWPALIVLFGASIVAQAFRPADPAAPAGTRKGNGVPCFFLFLLGVAMFASFGFPDGIETRAAGRAVATARASCTRRPRRDSPTLAMGVSPRSWVGPASICGRSFLLRER